MRITLDSYKPLPKIPCRFCQQPAVTLYTRLCGHCWEVSSRMPALPVDVLQNILNATRDETWTYAARPEAGK